MDDDRLHHLTTLFRALADPARLRILGLLAERSHTGRELSERLALTPPTVSHHLRRLVDLGIVTATPRAQSISYELNAAALRDTAAFARPGGPDGAAVADSSATAAERERAKVLRDFFEGDRLKQIPAQRKKRVVVLEHLLRRFEPGRAYPEREVNDLLRAAHEDVATLRRELVDYGFMNREQSIYRVASALPARGPAVAQEVRPDEHDWLRRLISSSTERALTQGSQ